VITFIEEYGLVQYVDGNMTAYSRAGQCEICKIQSDILVRDHCHMHGWVRGRLCHRCNSTITARYELRTVQSKNVDHSEFLLHMGKCIGCPSIGMIAGQPNADIQSLIDRGRLRQRSINSNKPDTTIGVVLPTPSRMLELRCKNGVSQTALAVMIGTGRRIVFSYEHGHMTPTGAKRVRYAAVLASWAELERCGLASHGN
jgi:DNA-binding transcriptional regulator YiaG